MNLPDVELAGLVGLYQLSDIVEHRRPLEPAVEHLSHEGARRGVVSAISTVDIGRKLASMFLQYAP